MKTSLVLVLGAAAVLAGACGGDDSEATTSSSASATSSTGSTGGGGSGSGDATSSSGSGVITVPDCVAPSPANPGKKVAVGTVKVTVQDKNGKGLPDALIDVQVCGSDLCLYGKSSDGSYTISNGGKELIDPSLKYGSQSGTQYLFWGGALPMGADVDFGVVTAVELGPVGGKLEKGATVTSNGVSVTFDPNARIEQELLAPEEPFAAVVFKPTDGKFPQLAASPVDFALIVGMGPADVDVCPPAKLSFPNAAMFPAKATVELWANGVKTYDNWVPYGTWAKVAEAVVSDDGKTVTTLDGKGIPALAAYGVTLKP
ncbi:MAG: hypothetical protein FJ095_09790 [Deltaproteobacteria bacterium]|nr:hypothetical protein [Deltaproteobacteria bacterium]